jgi:hypothetical protein
MPNRRLFWTTDFEQWSREICKAAQARSVLTLPEQFNVAFADFIAGRPLTSGLARCDPPKGGGIWRLKTPDLRLYGWADAPHCMVLAVGELVSVLKAPGPPKDRDIGRLAVNVRKQLGLDCIYGERYDIFPASR